MISYRVDTANPQLIADAAEGAYHKGGLSFEDLVTYLGKGTRTAQRVLVGGTQLKILTEEGNNYRVTKDGADLAKATQEQRPAVFKKFLVKYDPFIIFGMLVLKGNPLEDAVRKVKVIYNIPDDEGTILQAFRSWGLYTGAIEKTKDGYIVGIKNQDELLAQYIRDLVQAVQSEYTARLFISHKIREYAFRDLGDEEKDQFVDALMHFGTDGEKAVHQTGKAFETFLRKLGNERSLGTSNASGIGPLANILKGANVIVEQQRKLCETVAVYRNAADHGIDKDTMKHWKIEEDASLEAILLALTTTRSIYTYVHDSELLI
jgi:hypothetical protein